MYYKKYRTKKYEEKNIFDDAGNLGKIAIKAHEKGGMPLLLAFIGVVCLVITAFLVFTNIYKVWPIIFGVVALLLFISSVYLHVTKEKDVCPKCGKELIKKGDKSGKAFLACPGYPDCKFTKSLY